MADTSIAITAGAGTSIDTRTETTNSNHRQVVVLGDPALNANVAAVISQDGLATDETTPAIAVRSVGSLSVSIAGSSGTMAVHLQSTGGTIHTYLDPATTLEGITSSVAVHLVGTGGTIHTYLDPSTTLEGIQSSISIVPHTGVGYPLYDEPAKALRVLISGSHTAASMVISGQQAVGTNRPLIVNTDGAIKVYDLVSGTVSVVGITNSIQAHILSTNGTMAVNVGKVDGTVAVRLDPGYELGSIKGINSSISVHLVSTGGTQEVKIAPGYTVFTNAAHTSSIFTVSGSTSGGTTSGVTLVAPSASYNFKVFAYSLQTTGAVSQAIRFTNGGGSEAELWRPLITASGVTGVQGANLAVPPPGFIFATGANVTLAIKNDSGSLIHYSVSYIKESA